MKYRKLLAQVKFWLGASMMGWGLHQIFGAQWTLLVCGLIVTVSSAVEAVILDMEKPND